MTLQQPDIIGENNALDTVSFAEIPEGTDVDAALRQIVQAIQRLDTNCIVAQ